VNGHNPRRWCVTVTGKPPHYERRVYEIEGSEQHAAMTAIERFVEEMQARGERPPEAVNGEGLA